MRCECGFIVIGDFTIIKVHLFRPVYVLIVYYYSTCNNNNNSAFILISYKALIITTNIYINSKENATRVPFSQSTLFRPFLP